jgi:hypothetical protein
LTQVEIALPPQQRRMSLGQARAMRDLLERELTAERPTLGIAITAIALRFNDADRLYHAHRPVFYHKHKLDQLREVARFIEALERKR